MGTIRVVIAAAHTEPTIPRASREQSFVRILFILDRCGESVGSAAPSGAYRLMRGQVRLQKLDFWMRNPDYVADELIDEYLADRSKNWALSTAHSILDEREPTVRRLPMLKWRHGAYEQLDDTLALMTSRQLVLYRPNMSVSKVIEHLYWLTGAGHDIADQLLAADPVFRWYSDRADVIARLAHGLNGAALAARQYAHPEYGGTSALQTIPSIEARVRRRLAEVTAQA